MDRQHQGFKRVAILAENTDYGIGLLEETKKQFASSMSVKAELKSIIFDRAVVDLTPQVLEIKNWKPDLFINIGIWARQMYLIIKQAYDVGLIPATPMLISYDAPARPEYWKNVGEKGAYAAFIVYYHPTMKLDAAGRGLPQSLPRPVQGAAGLRRPQRLRAGHAARRCHDRGRRATSRTIILKSLLGNQVHGLERDRSRSRAATVPTGSSGAPPILFLQYTKPEHALHRGQDHLPAGSQDRRI